MRNLTLLCLVGAMGFGSSAMAAAVALDEASPFGAKKAVVRSAEDGGSSVIADSVHAEDDERTISPDLVPVVLDPDTAFQRVIVGPDGSISEADDDEGGVAGPGERLLYSNTLGINAVAIGNGLLLSDDITTTAPVGCNLTKFRFKVLGKVNAGGASGAYTVRYALYNICPQSVSNEFRLRDVGHPSGGIRIPGTSGEIAFPDDAPRTIEHVVGIPGSVTVPTNLWLGVQFLRSNCGMVVGAPAMVGHSADNWDQGGAVACSGFLGGFPEQPHASVWAEVFGGTNCANSFVAYRAAKASGTQINPAAQKFFADDIRLDVSNCQMIAYEVAVRNQGFYEFELRRDCTGPAIPGTQRTFGLNLSTKPQLQLARFTFDPPIALNAPDLFIAFKVNNLAAGVVLAGVQPSVGTTSENYFTIADDGTCSVVPPPQGSPITGAFHVSITCAGAQPLGACCDPYLTQCVGGADDGKRCRCNAVCVGGANDGSCCSPSTPCASPGVCQPTCAAPGSCESVCRQTALANCPFPPRGQDLVPKWVQGQVCTPDPFGSTPCGPASCCHIRINPVTQVQEEVCTNLTKNECEAFPPLDKARLWQLGLRCGSGPQECPRNACIARAGSCKVVHATPGCSEPFCCTRVCTQFGVDGAYCCNVEWDSLCVEFAEIVCNVPPGNDSCAPDTRGDGGAVLIPVPGSAVTNVTRATNGPPTEPGFCCNQGVGICIGGTQAGKGCVIASDCPGGICPAPTPTPGALGLGTVWFRFVQPQGQTTASVQTCTSNSPARDSVLQVFKVGDNSSFQNACQSLIPIGCNDDTPGCGFDGRNSRVCLTNLVPGETYYVAVAAKTEATKGDYRVTVSAGCSGGDVKPNDYCPNATTVTDGATPFNLTGSTFACPADACTPNARNDLWYNYTATCTGRATIQTCGPSSGQSPDTNLVVYPDCTKCPPSSASPVGCSTDVFGSCGFASRVTVDTVQGQCFKIRVTDNQGFAVSGNLTISCVQANDCQPNGIPDDVEIANCPANDNDCKDCNGNLIPDFCDIRDGLEQDCNLNGRPDSCEPDCQPNGIADECDITNCPPGNNACADCNANNIPDSCDIANGAPDVIPPGGNGRPDSCDVPSCPNGTMTYTNPPSGAVDARRPFPGNTPGTPEGFRVFTVTGPAGAAAASCWSMCERNQAGGPNAISSVVEGPAGTYTVTLARPITMNSTTTITYTPGAGAPSVGVFVSHPANINSDGATNPSDILALIDHLNGVSVPPLLLHQCDTDRSGACNPADILGEIDMLNGANGWPVQNGTVRPPLTCP